MHRRLSAAAVAALAALSFSVGCKDTNILRADLPVTTDTLVAYALTGTPASFPSGLSVTLRSTVRVDATGSFDVGFDISPKDSIVVSPVRVLVSQLVPTVPAVGIQIPAAGTTFESITRAPGGYYRPDTAVVVKPGQPFVLLTSRSTPSQTCLYDPTPRIYAKVVVDSIQPATRAVFMRVTTDLNCGYRSFEPGLPGS
jgi:hypothetical protein